MCDRLGASNTSPTASTAPQDEDLRFQSVNRRIPSSTTSSTASLEPKEEEEPLGLAGLEQLLRADIGSILPVGFGQKEDLVQAKSIHSLGEPDWSVTNNYLTLPLPPDYPNRQQNKHNIISLFVSLIYFRMSRINHDSHRATGPPRRPHTSPRRPRHLQDVLEPLDVHRSGPTLRH